VTYAASTRIYHVKHVESEDEQEEEGIVEPGVGAGQRGKGRRQDERELCEDVGRGEEAPEEGGSGEDGAGEQQRDHARRVLLNRNVVVIGSVLKETEFSTPIVNEMSRHSKHG
jgi:hypothetical protein